MSDTTTQHTIWHTGDTCPDCGHAIATNGRREWCTGCDTHDHEPDPTPTDEH